MSILNKDIDIYNILRDARSRLIAKVITEYDYMTNEELERITKMTELLDRLLELLNKK
jgi:predicted RecB family endonuclease